jgi:hypothetical protein
MIKTSVVMARTRRIATSVLRIIYWITSAPPYQEVEVRRVSPLEGTERGSSPVVALRT